MLFLPIRIRYGGTGVSTIPGDGVRHGIIAIGIMEVGILIIIITIIGILITIIITTIIRTMHGVA